MNTEGIKRNKYFKDNVEMHFLRLTVCPTTGGQFQLSVSTRESVVGLKTILAKKLKLRVDRMSLLFKDRLLTHGSLLENHLGNGSQLTLVPNMETGTGNVCTDSRVMQALENLSESQVNDFLTGRAPLFLAMKLGEHMMFVQLQLSASSACAARRRYAQAAPTPAPTPPTHSCHASNCNSIASEKSRCSCHQGQQGATSGAVIDSVNHLGHGVYSGTFSGTLDQSVHEPRGKPKRDITTILQILNDLLMASPQFRQSAAYTCPNYAKCYSGGERSPGQTNLGGGVSPGSSYPDTRENSSLRGKVQTLQRMMHERKLRRQSKRCLRGPYHWPSPRSPLATRPAFNRAALHTKYDAGNINRERAAELGNKTTTSTTEAMTTSSPGDTTSYPAPSTTVEHESVLV